VSIAAALVALMALRPLAERFRVVQINSCWSTLRRFARGRPTWLDQAIEIGARHVLDAAKSRDVDELAIVGHSAGGVTATAIIARALELDPELGRRGPRLVLLTLGSVMPGAALHPAAHRMRNIVERLACAPHLTWIDCQSRKDVMCFANFDPVEGIGVHVGAARCNPLLWRVSFKEMFEIEDYDRFRSNYFRTHYQYILAGDRPAAYDFIWLVAGPMAIAEWPKRHEELMDQFIKRRLAMNVATDGLIATGR
jgi:pimeloyl-ACP methyl ester carboxylesterase